jgi:hypothetical protein
MKKDRRSIKEDGYIGNIYLPLIYNELFFLSSAGRYSI